MQCRFDTDIDHCAIFMKNKGVFEYCCDMHVTPYDLTKIVYRILIEKQNIVGDVEFFMFPITVYGEVKPKVSIGSKRVMF